MCKLIGMYIILALLFLTIQDIRKREISLYLLLFLGAGVLASVIFCSDVSSVNRLLGAMVGVLLLLVGRFTREAIGYGDGMIVLLLGLQKGLAEIFEITFLAFFLAGVAALFLLCRRGRRQKVRIPLVPFFLVSYVGVMLL